MRVRSVARSAPRCNHAVFRRSVTRSRFASTPRGNQLPRCRRHRCVISAVVPQTPCPHSFVRSRFPTDQTSSRVIVGTSRVADTDETRQPDGTIVGTSRAFVAGVLNVHCRDRFHDRGQRSALL